MGWQEERGALWSTMYLPGETDSHCTSQWNESDCGCHGSSHRMCFHFIDVTAVVSPPLPPPCSSSPFFSPFSPLFLFPHSLSPPHLPSLNPEDPGTLANNTGSTTHPVDARADIFLDVPGWAMCKYYYMSSALVYNWSESQTHSHASFTL